MTGEIIVAKLLPRIRKDWVDQIEAAFAAVDELESALSALRNGGDFAAQLRSASSIIAKARGL